ncbi:dihydrofolate reductase family protein [Patulibacter sp. NPDC049589]|uniref:dihydrofolate reductase family protein n=1 Tax=Patulibacter sp. NPDC049589 TaxID=3154731 RepID=UPI00342E50AC
MGKLLYSVSMSLDGFIAGPGGDMSWLTAHLGPNPEAEALPATIGALLVGARTFRGDDPHRGDADREGKAFGGGWEGPQVVVTHRPPARPAAGLVFVTDVVAGIAAASEAAGGKWVNVLGADVARQCLEAGALDEILVFVAPVLLGDGVRVFAHPGGTNVRLERIATADAPGATMLRYRVA